MFFLFRTRTAFCPECSDYRQTRINRVHQIVFFAVVAFFLIALFYGWNQPALGHLILGRGGYGVLISGIAALMLLFTPRAHFCTGCENPFSGKFTRERPPRH